jgi:hypothetical protein
MAFTSSNPMFDHSRNSAVLQQAVQQAVSNKPSPAASQQTARLHSFYLGLGAIGQCLLFAFNLNLVVSFFPSVFNPLATPALTNNRDFMIAESLLPFSLLFYFLVYLGRPSTHVGMLEVVCTILGAASRSILAFAPDTYSDYGYMFVVDGLLVYLFLSVFLHRRRVLLVSTFSSSGIASFVYSTLPSSLVSALVGCVYLLAETGACMLESSSICMDTLRSNTDFAKFIVLVASARLLIVPYLTKNYTIADALRFDFEFGYQAQLIFLAVAALISLFAYGSKQDEGYVPAAESRWYITTESGRLLFQYAFYVSSIFFIAAVALTQNFLGVNRALSSRLPQLGLIGQQLRGRLRTRQTGRFAPALRGALIAFALLFLLPTLLSLMYAISITITRDKFENNKLVATQMFYMYGFSIIGNAGAAGIYFMSSPKGKQTSENALFVISVPLNILMSLTAAVLLDRPAIDKGIHIVLLFGAYLLFKSLHASRRYLAMHTDAHLDKHFCRGLVVIGSVIGPVLYLNAEAVACSIGSGDEADLERCGRLNSSNWTTAFNLVMTCVTYVAFEIEHLDVTSDDLIALRKVDAGSVVRGGLQSTALVISLATFGARPRGIIKHLDELTEVEYEAEAAFVSIMGCLMYIAVLIWLIVMAWQTANVNHLIMVEQESTGERESDTHVGRKRWAVDKWRNLMDRLNAWVEKNSVGAGEARMSPVYSFVVGFLSYALIILPIFAAAAILILTNRNDTEARNYASLMYHLSFDFKLAGATCVGIYTFMDLEVSAMIDGGDGSCNSNNKWQYRDLHACIIVIACVAEACVSYFLNGQVAATSIFNAACFSTLVSITIYQRRQALATATLEQRQDHVSKIVCMGGFSIAPSLIYMTSEVVSCDLFVFINAQIEGNALERETECNGIYLGIMPLLLILCSLFSSKLSFINVRSAFTTKNMSKLNLTFVESFQLALFGICGFYAMTAYALRSERVAAPDSIQAKLFACFGLLLLIAIASNLCKQGRREDEEAVVQEGGGGGESDTERLSGSRTNSHSTKIRRLSSVEIRNAVGNSRSIWDGGTRFTRADSGALKSASMRGIAVERARAEGAMGETHMTKDEDDDAFAAISPGYL